MPVCPPQLPASSWKVLLAFNPASGSFCPKALARLVRAFESEGHSVVLSNSREVDLAAGQAVDLVCAYG